MRSGGIELLNIDCMEYMKTVPDKAFDLAIVDPPYGLGVDGERYTENMVKSKSSGKWRNPKGKGYKNKNWDNNKPPQQYFNELIRVSKNQIIFGANHFNLPPSAGVIVWDKMKPEGFSLSQGEIAYVSSSNRMAIFKYLWHGFQKQKPEERIHPTQKPVELYKWILSNYCKQSIRCGNKHTKEYDYLCDICKHPFKILDTHLGSGSIAIACHDYKFELTATEIDTEYYEAACKRFSNHIAQTSLF